MDFYYLPAYLLEKIRKSNLAFSFLGVIANCFDSWQDLWKMADVYGYCSSGRFTLFD